MRVPPKSRVANATMYRFVTGVTKIKPVMSWGVCTGVCPVRIALLRVHQVRPTRTIHRAIRTNRAVNVLWRHICAIGAVMTMPVMPLGVSMGVRLASIAFRMLDVNVDNRNPYKRLSLLKWDGNPSASCSLSHCPAWCAPSHAGVSMHTSRAHTMTWPTLSCRDSNSPITAYYRDRVQRRGWRQSRHRLPSDIPLLRLRPPRTTTLLLLLQRHRQTTLTTTTMM